MRVWTRVAPPSPPPTIAPWPRPAPAPFQVAESTVAKKAARKLLRQIEESEERAELVEVRMAKALAVQIPKLDLNDSYDQLTAGGMQLPSRIPHDAMPL